MLVIAAPDERGLAKILSRVNAELFAAAAAESRLPLNGRKLHAHTDWNLE